METTPRHRLESGPARTGAVAAGGAEGGIPAVEPKEVNPMAKKRTKKQLRQAGLDSWAARRKRYGKTGISLEKRKGRAAAAKKSRPAKRK